MDSETARKCAAALTAQPYDYAGEIIARMFQGITKGEARLVFDHLARFTEKKFGGDLEPPKEVDSE